MTEAAFPPAIGRLLDSYTVPSLPQGFADRLIERAQLRADIAALPATRRIGASPWKRTGRVVASLAAIGLFTAAAAAGGIFGKPVYVPGITEAMQQANIIERKPVAVAHHARTKPHAAIAPALPSETSPDGKAKAKAAIAALRENPRFQQLRPRQKLRMVVRQTRALVKSGEITGQEGRAALRETAKENYEKLTPEQQAVVKQRIKQAHARRVERRQLWRDRAEQARARAQAEQDPTP